MSARSTFFLLVAAWSLPATASAEWVLSPHIGTRFAGSTNFVVGREGTEENKAGFGASIGFLTGGILGVEGEIAFIPGFFDGPAIVSSMITTLMGNAVIAAPLGATRYGLRPYVTAGGGLLRARGDDSAGAVISSNLFGVNFGGGAIGPVSPRTSLRFDLRYVRNLGNDSDARTFDGADVALSFWRGTVGLSFHF